jgi:predicted MFS family arabinose efflux permease
VTEAFTWCNAALVVGIAGGSALGGALAQGAGMAAPFALGCCAFALAAAFALSRRARFAHPAPSPLAE